MSVQNYTPGIKPTPWDITAADVDPRYRWFWDGRTKLATAFLDGGRVAYDTIGREVGTLSGGAASGITGETESYGRAIAMNADNAWIEFSGRGDVGDVDITFAMVLRDVEGAVSRTILALSSSTNASYRFNISSTDDIQFTKGGVVDVDTGLNIPDGPFFVVCSYRESDGLINTVTRSMLSGAIETATATNTANPNAGDGNWSVGGLSWITALSFHGPIGLAVVREAYHSMEELIEWAVDPFGPLSPALLTRYKAPAVVGTNPHNPFGHPFFGPFAGPVM